MVSGVNERCRARRRPLQTRVGAAAFAAASPPPPPRSPRNSTGLCWTARLRAPRPRRSARPRSCRPPVWVGAAEMRKSPTPSGGRAEATPYVVRSAHHFADIRQLTIHRPCGHNARRSLMVDKATLDGLRIERPAADARRRTPWMAIVPILILLLALGAWALTRKGAKEVTTASAKAVTSTSRGAVLNASGYVTARRRATVSSKVTGKVVEVFIEEGMKVTQGQELARLDAASVARGLALSQAEANAAASALEETRVRIREAQLDYDRAERLTRNEIASRADLDRARAQLDATRARLSTQSDQLTTARRNVDVQRQTVEDTIIRAPFDGIVVSKDAQPGEMISPVSAGGGFTRTGICTIVDMSSLEIEVDVNEAYINRVSPDQRVEAVLDAYPEWKIPAHVITAVPDRRPPEGDGQSAHRLRPARPAHPARHGREGHVHHRRARGHGGDGDGRDPERRRAPRRRAGRRVHRQRRAPRAPRGQSQRHRGRDRARDLRPVRRRDRRRHRREPCRRRQSKCEEVRRRNVRDPRHARTTSKKSSIAAPRTSAC